jgi:serine/threonine-protein phosphatase 2A regulatory subunit A
LIPFVNESVDDEDEVLLALAEELGDFVPLVGGPQHAHFLLPPLEALASVDETVVRERAVASIASVTGQMPAGAVQEHLLPLVQVRCVAVCERRDG